MSDTNEQKIDELLSLMRAAVPDAEGMSDAGKIGFVYKGEYSAETEYEKLDVALYGPSLWTPKQTTAGNAPPDQSADETVSENDYWQLFLPGALGGDYVKKTDLAQAPTDTEPGKPGISMPDGKTITADPDGTLHGASQDKVLTNEELQEILASGEAEDGTKAFVSGIPASGNQGILLPLDHELKDSMNAVRNYVIKNALDRLEGLIAEVNGLRSTLETFGLSKICPVDVTDVTEDSGLVLGAKEKNASVEGTLGNLIKALDAKTNAATMGLAVNSDYVTDVSCYNAIILGVCFVELDVNLKNVSQGGRMVIGGLSNRPIYGDVWTRVVASDGSICSVGILGANAEIHVIPESINSSINLRFFAFYQGTPV